MPAVVKGQLILGQKYLICTGTIGTTATYRGVVRCKGSSERVLLFENEEATDAQYRFIGAVIDLHLPYTTYRVTEVMGQLLAKYYGQTADNLRRQGISQEEWELC